MVYIMSSSIQLQPIGLYNFITLKRALWIPSFRKKYSSITKLFNFENCVILAQIRFNLTLSNLDIFEIFDTADQS